MWSNCFFKIKKNRIEKTKLKSLWMKKHKKEKKQKQFEVLLANI